MKRQPDIYKETRVYEFPGCKATVHIPDLTEAERAKRMQAIERAAIALIRGR